jgi:hypothetical protein
VVGDSGVDFNVMFDGKLAGRNERLLGWSKDHTRWMMVSNARQQQTLARNRRQEPDVCF